MCLPSLNWEAWMALVVSLKRRLQPQIGGWPLETENHWIFGTSSEMADDGALWLVPLRRGGGWGAWAFGPMARPLTLIFPLFHENFLKLSMSFILVLKPWNIHTGGTEFISSCHVIQSMISYIHESYIHTWERHSYQVITKNKVSNFFSSDLNTGAATIWVQSGSKSDNLTFKL